MTSAPEPSVSPGRKSPATALVVLERRWSLSVLLALLDGPLRFGSLRSKLPAISANILVRRLSDLEEAGLVRRARLPAPAEVQVYGLVDVAGLSSLLQSLCDFVELQQRTDP